MRFTLPLNTMGLKDVNLWLDHAPYFPMILLFFNSSLQSSRSSIWVAPVEPRMVDQMDLGCPSKAVLGLLSLIILFFCP